jgi:hypothetical protein
MSRRKLTHSAISVSSVVLCSSLFCRRNGHWTRSTSYLEKITTHHVDADCYAFKDQI